LPTLERINPIELDFNEAIDEESFKIHLERYAFAVQQLIPGNILDIACGTGYGSKYIAEHTSNLKIAAVDVSEDAIKLATEIYNHTNIEYHVGNAYKYIPPFSVTNVISLETIEHLENPQIFIEHICSFLNSGSRIIVSVPITPTMDYNPYHLHDYTAKKICSLFESKNCRLINSKTQIQKFNFKKIFQNKNPRIKINILKLFFFYAKKPQKIVTRINSLLKDGLATKYFIGVFEKT
jgi:2-polyprenyl-3-methyl-5-hydroxy-6-metoxy-1,4-benzoquinol methylase